MATRHPLMATKSKTRQTHEARVLAAAEQVAASHGVVVVVASGAPPSTHERAVLRVWTCGSYRLELSSGDLEEVAAWLRALSSSPDRHNP